MISPQPGVVVTGAAGYLGGAVARILLSSGIPVVAVVRHAEQGLDLVGRGADVVQADIATTAGRDVLRRTLAQASGYVHAATVGPRHMVDVATAAAQALPGDDLPVVLLQGAMIYGDTGPRPVEESAEPHVPPFLRDVADAEAVVLGLGGVRPVSVRLGNVHGGGGAIASSLLAAARVDLVAGYPGSGDNAWSTIHVDDAARLIMLAVTDSAMTGVVNGASEDLTVRQLADAVGEALGLTGTPVHWDPAAAQDRLGFFAEPLTWDLRLSSRLARSHGWQPVSPAFADALRADALRADALRADARSIRAPAPRPATS